MNIWIFNHYANAPGDAGGSRHYDLAKQLVKKGEQVTIFASSFNHQTRQEKHLPERGMKQKEENYDGVRFLWFKTTPYQKNDWRRVLNMFSYTLRAYRHARETGSINLPDIVIGSLMHPFAAVIGYLLARRFGCKFYFEERDLWPQTLIDLGKVSKNSPVTWALSQVELYLYKKADRIIVLFDKAPNYIQQRGIDQSKVIYLPNGVDLSRFDMVSPSLPQSFEELLARLKGKFIAIYTGAHGLANHLDVLLDAAKLIKEEHRHIHFLFVGDGPEKARLVKRSEDELLDNVTFMPSVSKEVIPTLLQYADVGLISMKNAPLYKWGFSLNKMHDYMAASLPVILLCHLNDTPVEVEKAGIVIKEQFSRQLADVLVGLSNDEEQVAEMGKRGRAYVESAHSWDRLADKLYKAMLEDIHSGARKVDV